MSTRDAGAQRPRNRWVALARAIIGLPGLVLLGLLRFYQRVISPMTPPTCRYYPSCSSYAVTAISRHGALRGTWLAVRRVLRCHPWSAGGVDDVPPVRHTPTDHRAAAAASASLD